jgi:hypothetical protein
MKFIYGSPVEKDNFVNRVNEKLKLIDMITSYTYDTPTHIEISAPRRIGKTSLVKEVGNVMRSKGYTFVEIDLMPVNSIQKFFIELKNNVIDSLTYTEAAYEKIKTFITRVRLSSPDIKISSDGFSIDNISEIIKLKDENWEDMCKDIFMFLRSHKELNIVISLDEMGFIRSLPDRKEAEQFLKVLDNELSTEGTPLFIINGSQNFLYLMSEFSHELSSLWKRKLISFDKLDNFSLDVTKHLFVTAMMHELSDYSYDLKRKTFEKIATIVYHISSGHPSFIQMIGKELTSEIRIAVSRGVELNTGLIKKILIEELFEELIIKDKHGLSKTLLSKDSLGERFLEIREIIKLLYSERSCSIVDVQNKYNKNESLFFELLNIAEKLNFIDLNVNKYTIKNTFLKYYIGHPMQDKKSKEEVEEKWKELVSEN